MNFVERYLNRTCWLEIDLDNIINNVKILKNLVGPNVKVMPAVKANAYGHGILEPCKALVEGGADILAVGSIEDGKALRNYGIDVPILVFASNTVIEVADLYIQNNLIPTILSFPQAESISNLSGDSAYPIFIKIETGRGRIGINAETAVDAIKKINDLPGIKIEGIYSHLTSVNWPEDGNEYINWQFQRFATVKEGLESENIDIPFYQLANSAGTIALQGFHLSGICPGRAIWGYCPLREHPNDPKLEQALKAWKSKIIQVKEVIGGNFGPKFKATQLDSPLRIGVIPVGSSDGIYLKHHISGEVLIRGKRVPIGSKISLEHTTLDLSNFPDVEVGDEVVILGKQGNEEITHQELENKWGRSLNNFLTSINPEMPRVYYKNGKPISISFGYKIIKI